MLASQADRERAIDTLKAAYVYGLVSKDEFDERVGQTLASRTRAELARITADIPAGLPAAPATLSPAPAPATPAARPGGRAIVATAALAGLALIAAFFVGNATGGLLAFGAANCALASLFLAAAQTLKSRRDKRADGRPRPPLGAPDAARNAGQLPPARRARRHRAADAAWSQSPRPQLST